MSFLREKQTRRFILSLITLSIVLFATGAFLSKLQTQKVKEMMLSHDYAIASSLLSNGVSPDVIATAVACEQDNGEGIRLLTQLGFTQKTSARFLPMVSRFEIATLLFVLLGIVIFISMIFTLCYSFYKKREQLYHQAQKVILMFLQGDFTTHLNCAEEGTLYQLFGYIDNLASQLQAKQEAESKAKIFLKDTISDISHQLKTPLAALNMYNEIILSEPNNPTTIMEFSKKTTLALERMEHLIQSLLKITRLDAKNIMFEKAPHRISDIIAHATTELTTRARYEEKQIIITGEPDEQIICDRQWTCEAIGNIIKNALDHTNPGGHICISFERSLAITRILITDDGEGIAPEEIHHIFKRFYRSKNSKDAQGVGLGLSLAKSIVEGQGGFLSVSSNPNQGTTFTLSFLTEL